MGLIAFDIETVVSDEGKKLVADCDVKAPANYKDPEKISAYVDEKKKELLDKAALYWWTGKIICISAVDVDTGDKFCLCDNDERDLLCSFFTFLGDKPTHRLIGKNSDEFDLPWLRARAMRHDIGLTNHLRLFQTFSDVQKIFGWGRQASQVTSLDNMGKALCLATQKGGHGSEVAKLWADGRTGELMQYCMGDSQMVAEIWRRYEKEFKS
jgi:predicted PolB exonuclease-like 3'-5' exonuclease